MTLEHVPDCQCRYFTDPITGGDAKLIDSRCIAAYLVPSHPGEVDVP